MKKQFAVIGLGTFGLNVALNLAKKGADVLAIDAQEERITEIADIVTRAVQADATEEKTLRSLGLNDIETAIVSIGENMEASILVTLLLKEIGVKNVIAKGLSYQHAQILSRIGADRIIFPEREVAERLADSLMSPPNILEEISLSPDYNLVELRTPPSFVGKTLRKLDVRAKFNVSIIGIRRKTPIITDEGETNIKEELILVPSPEEEINTGDVLVLVGFNDGIERLKSLS